jgi:DNA-binding transcriptional LysR family regulator
MIGIMQGTHIDKVDLNLLPALVALLEERHVSRAAQRAGLSQPAMSRAFHRLRRTLGDDLLVRTPGGYHLTPRAERIQDQLATIVPGLDRILSEDAFDPATVAQTVRLGGTDYAVAVIGPDLTRRVLAESPLSAIQFLPWHPRVADDLDRGAVDLAFVGAQTAGHLRTEHLFDDRFVCVVAGTHPLAGRTAVELGDYLQFPHVIVDVDGYGQPAVDRVLAARGTPRRSGLTVPVHAAAALALPGTELVLTLPERLTGTFAVAGTTIIAAPPEIETMAFRMAWHPRLELDPAHVWLRDTVRAVTSQLRAPRSPSRRDPPAS